jgi:hypothetical protein
LVADLPQRNASHAAWLESAVFTLDRWLRRRQAIYEYSNHPRCLFRIQCVRIEQALEFVDGTSVRPGSRALALHLWNEHIPPMGERGPTLAWARKANRAIYASLRELARYLAGRPDLSDVAAICGDMRVRGVGQAARLARIAARYGFETSTGTVDGRGVLHRIGDGLLILLLAAVTNPLAMRSSVLRHGNMRLFLSRAALEKRYGATAWVAPERSSAPHRTQEESVPAG